jgi:hypothetical protein
MRRWSDVVFSLPFLRRKQRLTSKEIDAIAPNRCHDELLSDQSGKPAKLPMTCTPQGPVPIVLMVRSRECPRR